MLKLLGLGPSLADSQNIIRTKYREFLENRGLCEPDSHAPLPNLAETDLTSKWKDYKLSDKAIKKLASVLNGKDEVTHQMLRAALGDDLDKVWERQHDSAKANPEQMKKVLQSYLGIPGALEMRSYSFLGDRQVGAVLALKESPLVNWRVSLDNAGGLSDLLDDYAGGRDVEVNLQGGVYKTVSPDKFTDVLIRVAPISQTQFHNDLNSKTPVSLTFASAVNILQAALPDKVQITHSDNRGGMMKIFPDSDMPTRVLEVAQTIISHGGAQGAALRGALEQQGRDISNVANDITTAALARTGLSAVQAYSISERKDGIYVLGGDIEIAKKRLGRVRQVVALQL